MSLGNGNIGKTMKQVTTVVKVGNDGNEL